LRGWSPAWIGGSGIGLVFYECRIGARKWLRTSLACSSRDSNFGRIVESTKPYPENILVYRDGVSEGEYNRVIEQELPKLRAACEFPAFTIVIVVKRHHTRFYASEQHELK
jgi:Piwi domain